jgi:hypothetical protein
MGRAGACLELEVRNDLVRALTRLGEEVSDQDDEAVRRHQRPCHQVQERLEVNTALAVSSSAARFARQTTWCGIQREKSTTGMTMGRHQRPCHKGGTPGGPRRGNNHFVLVTINREVCTSDGLVRHSHDKNLCATSGNDKKLPSFDTRTPHLRAHGELELDALPQEGQHVVVQVHVIGMQEARDEQPAGPLG